MSAKIFAHRGSSGIYAEHTRAAYLQAIADQADGVECDVQLTSCGAVVLLHDETVDRTSNGSGAVAQLSLEQLRELDVSSWKGADIPAEYGDSAQQLLTLPELMVILQGAGREIALAIELKYGAAFSSDLVEAVYKDLEQFGWDANTSMAGNVAISFMCFHPEAVAYVAEKVPSASICQLLESEDTEGIRLIDSAVAEIAGPGVDSLIPYARKVNEWLALGRIFRIWTVDNKDQLDLCLGAGVQEITTNYPARIREWIAGR